MTGAKKVIVFHNQLRGHSPTAGKDIRKPAFFAHIDYTEDTFKIRARELLGDEADQCLGHRMAAYKIWRGVKPVEEKPIASCDARTVQHTDRKSAVWGESGQDCVEIWGGGVLIEKKEEKI